MEYVNNVLLLMSVIIVINPYNYVQYAIKITILIQQVFASFVLHYNTAKIVYNQQRCAHNVILIIILKMVYVNCVHQ